MKKLLIVLSTLIISATALFGGCFSAYVTDIVPTDNGYVLIYSNGTQKVVEDSSGSSTVTDIFEITNENRVQSGLEPLTFDEFLKEYLNYSSEQIEKEASLQANINKSLTSGVSLVVGFQSGRGEISYANGSGVIYQLDKASGTAYIVTNAHMVYSPGAYPDGYSNDIYCYLYGQDISGVNYGFDEYGRWHDTEYQMKATIVGVAKEYDLAVIKVANSDVLKNNDVTAATFCQDEHVYVGETVYAVGNADGEGMGTTLGIISKDSVDIYIDIEDTNNPDRYVTMRAIRTDAAINGGNSGGALYNANGEIVGIVNSKNDDADIDNMGYAIPASLAKRVVKSMIDNYTGVENHYVYKALMGVYLGVSSTTVQYNDEKCATEIIETVVLSEFASATSKWSGKLNVDDVITEVRVKDKNGNVVDGATITRMHTVSEVLHSVRDGYTVEIDYLRSGVKGTATVTYAKSELTKVS